MSWLLDFLKERYSLGVRWSLTDDLEPELVMQVFYIQALVVGSIIMYKIEPDRIGVYLVLIAIHLVSMYLFGFLKSSWEGEPKERKYATIYKIINLILIIASILINKSLHYVAVIICATILGALSQPVIGIAYNIEEFLEEKKSEDPQNVLAKIPYSSVLIINILAYIFALIAIWSLPLSTELAFAISVLYVIIMPFVVVAADDGMNFFDLWMYW